MAITFESIRDPYGLGEAGSAIGDAMLQKSMMEAQQKRKIADEERQRNQQIQNSQTLGTTLKDMMPAEGQQWDQDRVASFMAQALESGASMNDVLNTIKGLQTGQAKQAPQSVYMKEMAKKNAGLMEKFSQGGRKAKEMLGMIDPVRAAINDPERADNFLLRTAKSLPGAEIAYGASDQALANFSKEFVSNFSGMEGLRLTDAKLKWIQGITPSPTKSKEANLIALANSERLLQIQEAYGDISRSIADGYIQAGLDVPPNFEKIVEDAVEPLRKEIDQMYKMSTENAENPQKSTEVGSKFEKMPNAKDYEGAEITDSKGNKFVSNGTKWSKVK